MCQCPVGRLEDDDETEEGEALGSPESFDALWTQTQEDSCWREVELEEQEAYDPQEPMTRTGTGQPRETGFHEIKAKEIVLTKVIYPDPNEPEE